MLSVKQPSKMTVHRVDRSSLGSKRRWHLDEDFVKIYGAQFYLWRAIDQEGEVLEAYVSRRRNKAAALKFMGTLLRRYRSLPQFNHQFTTTLVTNVTSTDETIIKQNREVALTEWHGLYAG